MTLPRFCKICRLIIHYPDLEKDDWDEDMKRFEGKGYCPDGHYEVNLHEYEDRTEIWSEILRYNEYEILIDYNSTAYWIEIYKDSKTGGGEPAIVTTIESWKDVNYRDKDAVLYKLDTLINFS